MSMCHTNNPNYFTPEGFFLLWNKAKESTELEEYNGDSESIPIRLIDPQVLPYEWAKFLGWKGGGTDES